MVATGSVNPLVCIVGVTGSGKSALAIELAERFGGELICADSRTVYQGMNIGTAKPTAEDQARVPHYGLDLVRPDEPFTVADFKAYATGKIQEITAAGSVSILVGGTGLYVDAILYDYSFRSPADPARRQELSALSIDELQRRIRGAGYTMPTNDRNPRHLVRVLETEGQADVAGPLREQTIVIGLDPGQDVLRDRLRKRVDTMVQAGLVDEIDRLQKQYGWDVPAMQAPGYRAFRAYMEGSQTLDQATAAFVHNDLQLARRQRTWFRRNKSIQWFSPDEMHGKSVELITTQLNT